MKADMKTEGENITKIGVRILPKAEVLDTQGRAIEDMLRQNGKGVGSCRVGKFVILEFPGLGREKALTSAEDISKFVLFNPLIETFELEVLPE